MFVRKGMVCAALLLASSYLSCGSGADAMAYNLQYEGPREREISSRPYEAAS